MFSLRLESIYLYAEKNVALFPQIDIHHTTDQRWERKCFCFSPQIANPQILGLNQQSQIRKFLMYASPQISLINPQIANPQIS
jgi:hypothetical protein